MGVKKPMPRRLTAHLQVAVPPALRERLEREAQRRRRSLSSLIRVLLEQALRISERTPDPVRDEYEIRLSPVEAGRLTRRGYELTDE